MLKALMSGERKPWKDLSILTLAQMKIVTKKNTLGHFFPSVFSSNITFQNLL